jgi:hypothetical protein
VTPERRRQGRAIRKRRRESREVVRAFLMLGHAFDQITSAMSDLARAIEKAVTAAVEYIMAADIPGVVARMESHARKVRRAVSVVNMDC